MRSFFNEWVDKSVSVRKEGLQFLLRLAWAGALQSMFIVQMCNYYFITKFYVNQY